jgi:hypothetical protein
MLQIRRGGSVVEQLTRNEQVVRSNRIPGSQRNPLLIGKEWVLFFLPGGTRLTKKHQNSLLPAINQPQENMMECLEIKILKSGGV